MKDIGWTRIKGWSIVLHVHFFKIYTELFDRVEDMLGIGVSRALSLVHNPPFLAYHVVWRTFATFPGVHTVFEAFTAGIPDVTRDAMGRSAFVGIVVTCNVNKEYKIRNINYPQECSLNENINHTLQFIQ